MHEDGSKRERRIEKDRKSYGAKGAAENYLDDLVGTNSWHSHMGSDPTDADRQEWTYRIFTECHWMLSTNVASKSATSILIHALGNYRNVQHQGGTLIVIFSTTYSESA